MFKFDLLRFVEFKDGWKSKTLGEISEIYGRIGFRGYTVKDLVSEGEGALTLGGKHINSNNRLDLSEPDYLSWDKYEESPEIKVSKGDIITSQRGTLGRSAYIFNDIGKATINPSMVLLKKFKEDGIFLYYTLIHQNFIKEVYRRSSSTAVPMISQSELKKININFPSLNEQKKIANFLSNVDEKLELLNQKLNQTTQFKKYLMQNIFSQKLRFDFDDEWKQYKLKDLLTVKSSSISINQLEDNTGEYPLYGASGFLKNIDFCEMETDYISIVKDGSGVGNLSYHEKNSSIVNTSQYLLPKKDFNIHFLYYQLQTLNLLKYVNGSSIPHIYFKDYCIEKVTVPSLPEQQKIGKLFVDTDKTIENIDNCIQVTQEFKKGLLQQMFV